MDTIRNILKPGGNVDDEIMYGSGTSTNPAHTGNSGTLSGEGTHLASSQATGPTSGEGSHFSGTRDTTAGTGATGPTSGQGSHFSSAKDSSNVGNTTTTSGPHSSNLANKADPRVDSNPVDYQGAGNTNTGYGSTGGSAMPGGFPNETQSDNPYSSKAVDPRLGGNSQTTSSGVPQTENTNTTTQSGLTAQNTTGNTGHHYARDGAALGGAAAVGEGIHHHRDNERAVGPESTSTINHPDGTTSTSTNTTTSTTTGPHNSSLLNKLDPRVKNDQTNPTGSADTSGHQYGRDAAAIGGSAAVGEGIHHHRGNERDNLASGTSGYSGTTPSGAGQSYYGAPTGTASTTSTQGSAYPQDSTTTQGSGQNYGRDAAAVGGAAAVGEGIHHHRENERENLSGNSGYTGTTPSGAGSGTYYGGPSGTAVSGPHETATANRLDPRVNTSGAPIDDVHQHHAQTGGGAEQADLAHGDKEHHHGRDAAGVGAAGLGAHELSKHHKEKELEKEQGYGSTTGSTTAPTNVSSTQQARDKEHHYGRDAAGVGAAGVGAHELSKHHKEKELEKDQGYGSTTGSTISPANVSSTQQTHDKEHHFGRDAAGVGAAGVGAHELSKDYKETEQEKQQRLGNTPYSTTATGASAPTTGSGAGTDTILTGPVHKSSLLNKLDPRVKEVSRDSAAATTGAQDPADASKDHHYGRDAAGVGAAGLGAHELSKHHKEKELEKDQARGSGLGQSSGATGTHHHGERDAAAAAPLTGAAGYEAEKRHAGQHPHDSTQPGYDSTKDHHYGRDAAGVGAAGLGAHELSNHHKERELEKEQGYGTTGTSAGGLGTTTGESEHEKLKREAALNQKGNHYGQELPGPTSGTVGNTATEKDHHYGRDAAGAGVVGAGAYEAEKHHSHDKDQKALEKEQRHEEKAAEKEQKRELKEEKREEKRELKEEKKEEKKSGHGGLLGFLHRDKNKKYSKEEEDEFDRQEREQNSHKGRDAAIGAGAAGVGAHELNKHHKEKEAEKEQGYASTPGQTNTSSHLGRDAAGAGAVGYEAEKHQSHHHTGSDTMKPLPVAPGNNGIGTGEGTKNALVMDRKRGEGYSEPVGESSLFSTLGDKLHGPERNRGVDMTSGTIAGTNEPADEKFLTGPGAHPHVGRDAALGAGAGGVGAAAYEHEHNKRDTTSETGYNTSSTGGNYNTNTGNTGYDNTTSGYGSTGQTASQIPRESALGAGGSGGVSGLSHQSSSSGGHNKLHKDPPRHHPASQGGMTEDGRFIQPGTGRTMESGMPTEDGSEYPSNVTGPTGTHVPASGAQREQMVGQGVQGDTGVANPHGDGSRSY